MAAALLLAAAWWQFRQPRAPAVASRQAPAAARGDPAFIGSQACAGCHQEIAAQYQRSGMSRSWQHLDSSLPLNLPPGSASDDVSGYGYAVAVEQGRLWQEETLHDRPSHRLRKAASYAIGSGKHIRSFAAETNGYLTLLPAAWFADEQTWRLNPGFELRNQRFDRPIVPGCVACHGGQADFDLPTRNHFRLPIGDGIGCERCHGPGRDHAAFHHASSTDASPRPARDPMPSLGRLSAARLNDICLQCHLQGDVSVYPKGQNPQGLRPGQALPEHRLDYLLRDTEVQSLGIASHGARLMLSSCYATTRLTCVHCHDPHRPVDDFSREYFDNRCLSCHTTEPCGRSTGEAPEATSSCTICHMPQRATQEVPHLAFTDHWIRSIPASRDDPRADGTSPSLTDSHLHSCFSEGNARAQLGIAYVLLHETMGPRESALVRGIELLQSALRDDPRDRQATFWLASALIARQHGNQAVPLLEELLAPEPNWHEARFRLAVAYDQQGNYAQAIDHYERVIAAAPSWLDSYPLAVRLHLFARNPVRAEQLSREHLLRFPDAGAYASLALARQMQLASTAEVLAWIDRALAEDPRSVSAHLNRGYLRLTWGEKTAAGRDFQQVLGWDPHNAKAQAGWKAAQEP